MGHLVFVYGTLLRGEVNHRLLSAAEYLGDHKTEPRFTLLELGAYPGVVLGGHTAISGEIYRVGEAAMRQLDRLEDYPRLYDRVLISSAFGRTWIYVYRGRIQGRRVIASGDWRDLTQPPDAIQATAVRTLRDPKNPRWRVKSSRSQP
jgi:gamma-glutamylcyclotransferase (GGCT)/AIG2-like uncharacterized protein YtfP